MAPHLFGSSLRFLACAVALAFAHALAAQEPPRVIVSGGDRIAFATTVVSPLSDDAIRSLVQAHLPDELLQTDPRHITLVVDANDEYVTSKVAKATVIKAEGNGTSFVYRDTTGANVGPIIIRRASAGDSASVASDKAFSITTSRSDDGASGVFGTGYTMSEVASIGLRRFSAGQLGTSALVVSVVKLK